jgi:hypothetical protein
MYFNKNFERNHRTLSKNDVFARMRISLRCCHNTTVSSNTMGNSSEKKSTATDEKPVAPASPVARRMAAEADDEISTSLYLDLTALDPLHGFIEETPSVYGDCVNEYIPDDAYIAQLEEALGESNAKIEGKHGMVLVFANCVLDSRINLLYCSAELEAQLEEEKEERKAAEAICMGRKKQKKSDAV